ncbi:hypothetical protein D0T26_23200 [Duganella sp. BJB489]|nr:hypothetical protein D0T26_23200 [Duganella sp. BJB489]
MFFAAIAAASVLIAGSASAGAGAVVVGSATAGATGSNNHPQNFLVARNFTKGCVSFYDQGQVVMKVAAGQSSVLGLTTRNKTYQALVSQLGCGFPSPAKLIEFNTSNATTTKNASGGWDFYWIVK